MQHSDDPTFFRSVDRLRPGVGTASLLVVQQIENLNFASPDCATPMPLDDLYGFDENGTAVVEVPDTGLQISGRELVRHVAESIACGSQELTESTNIGHARRVSEADRLERSCIDTGGPVEYKANTPPRPPPREDWRGFSW